MEEVQMIHMKADVELDITQVCQMMSGDKGKSSIDNMLSMWLQYQNDKEEK